MVYLSIRPSVLVPVRYILNAVRKFSPAEVRLLTPQVVYLPQPNTNYIYITEQRIIVLIIEQRPHSRTTVPVRTLQYGILRHRAMLLSVLLSGIIIER